MFCDVMSTMVHTGRSFVRKHLIILVGILLFIPFCHFVYNQTEEYSYSKLENSNLYFPNNPAFNQEQSQTGVHSDGDNVNKSSSRTDANHQSIHNLSINFNYSSSNMLIKDIQDAGFIIQNADLCPEAGKKMKVLILVSSAPNHREARMAIRQTWGFHGKLSDFGIGFVVGVSNQLSWNADIQAEQHTYGDLIQARFVESYTNLTLKTVAILEWVNTYCPQVPFILKCDDDMFINIAQLLSLLVKQQPATRSMFGRLAHNWQPVRQISSRYFISPLHYQLDTFPDFLTGPAYLMTGDCVPQLHQRALQMAFLKLEDVLITGLAAASLGIRLVHVPAFFNYHIDDVCRIRDAITVHGVGAPQLFTLWAHLYDNKSLLCEVGLRVGT